MKSIEYIYTSEEGTIVNCIEFKFSQNSKIGEGLVIQTYHFSIKQVETNDFSQDGLNCLDCPLSKTNGYKLGQCYTHKGLQLMGLKSKLRKLHKMYKVQNLDKFSPITFKEWQIRVKNQLRKNTKKGIEDVIKLVRFGAYGEPIFLGENLVSELAKMGKNITGYSHQYNKDKYNWAKGYFMASTHNAKDKAIAKNRGFRQFNVVLEDENIENSINCPSSAEFEAKKGFKVDCINCSLCSGQFKSIKKDIHILAH